jgi:hypothetical protein
MREVNLHHIKYIDTADSKSVDLQILREVLAHAQMVACRGWTYVWFSPFGERNHAAAQKQRTTKAPMKGAHPFAIANTVFGDAAC